MTFGQPSVIIWTNYDGLESQMLHAKFCGNRSTDSGEEDVFEGFLPHMGMAAILVMWPALCSRTFISLYLKAYIQNLVKNGQVVSWKNKLKGLEKGCKNRNPVDTLIKKSSQAVVVSCFCVTPLSL